MMGEGLMYCMQSKMKSCPKSESSINAGGCNFNSFLRRTVRFVGMCNLFEIVFIFLWVDGTGLTVTVSYAASKMGTILVLDASADVVQRVPGTMYLSEGLIDHAARHIQKIYFPIDA